MAGDLALDHWAMIGDADHCRRQLDAAAELLRGHSGETDPAGPIYLSKELHTLHGTLLARWPDQPDARAFHDALAAS